MHVVSMLTEIPAELWGVALGGAGGTVTAIIATVKTIKAKLDEERKKIVAGEEQRRSELIAAVAEVTAKVVNTEIDHSLEARHYTRSEQIQVARNALEIYADSILESATEAVKTMIEPTHPKFELVKALYIDAIKNSFITDVHQYFIRIISKNGFLAKDEEKYIYWCREVLTPAAYSVWRGSMLRRFANIDEIRLRVEWSDKNTNRDSMKDMVTGFMMECRDMSRDYYEKRELNGKNLSARIQSEIIAQFSKSKIDMAIE